MDKVLVNASGFLYSDNGPLLIMSSMPSIELTVSNVDRIKITNATVMYTASGTIKIGA